MKNKVRCDKCGNIKHHEIHTGSTWEHDFVDPRRPGLKPMSEQRQRYLDSQEHKDAYAEHSRSNECAAEAAGAPGKCLLPLTPHHIAPRGAFGGQRAAEKFPVVTLCAYHNEWVQQDAYGREWAKAHYFHRDGQDWPFLMSPRDTFIYGTKVVEDL